VLSEALRLLDYANLALAFSMEALEGIIDAFDEKVHQVRGHFGQIKVAKQVQNYLKGSEYVSSSNPKRVQDAYSLRCAPQVHGASYGALLHVRDIVNQEMNAVTDNPLLFVEDGVALSAGNFHGEPLALAFDYMGMAIAELASISERRLERMVNPQLSNGLPPFLAVSSGVNSGMMIVQYTAASLVSENKVLAHPASVDSIPSSANQEDHVSMGTISARKARTILNNTRRVIALEMLVAFQAIQFRTKKQMGNQTKKLFDLLSKNIPFFKEDTILYPYMHFVEELLKKEDTSQILKEGD
ncbi:MAG: aromatic amino acid lyase, partial [Bacilli bacterium]|nr:aromatic amino acid lyase [Bacilli bacterium]